MTPKLETKLTNNVSFSLLLIFLFVHICPGQDKSYKIRTVAFYNVENMFDTINDPEKLDDDYTKGGKNKYTFLQYKHKIENIARVISNLGFDMTHTSPAILGLAEIENRQVLEDLIWSDPIKDYGYQFIHFDSPDIRGIDVALLYQPDIFAPLHQENLEIRIWNETGARIYTRDLLWVSGIMDNEVIHVLVNHWPSRRGGKARSQPKRMKAAYVVRDVVKKILVEQEDAKIIIMGDFNDDPLDKSIIKGLIGSRTRHSNDTIPLFNPMEKLYKKGLNTLAYRDGLNLFDQIILSKTFKGEFLSSKGFTLYMAGIYNPEYITKNNGKYKGYPFRSFENNRFVGGYSDHFPVYLYLIKPDLP